MGWFSSAVDLLRGKKEQIKKWAQEKVEEVLDWVDSKIGDSKAVDASSSADQVNDVNEILLDYSERYRHFACELENDCLALVQKRFEETMELLNARVELKRDFKQEIKALRRRHEEFCATIPDAITGVVAKRVSIDDSECRSILALTASDSKRYKLRNFCKAVVREANDNLAQRVHAALVEQANEIDDALDEYMEEKEQNLSNMQRIFAQMESEVLEQTTQTSRKRYVPMKLVYVTEKTDQLLSS